MSSSVFAWKTQLITAFCTIVCTLFVEHVVFSRDLDVGQIENIGELGASIVAINKSLTRIDGNVTKGLEQDSEIKAKLSALTVAVENNAQRLNRLEGRQ